MDGNKIGNPGATALGRALASNSSLVAVFLEDCGIGATGSSAIADALDTNACLADINFAGNKIGDAGATALGRALASNSSMVEISLEGCRIGSSGSSAIADALETNIRLKSLCLSENDIGDAGAKALAHVLASTASLESLHLADCSIGDNGMAALIEAYGINLAFPVEPDVIAAELLEVGDLWNDGRLREVRRVRDAVLRKRGLLLAFGMAMIPRLGGGPEKQAHAEKATMSTREKPSPFHHMNRDVFKLVGGAYGAY